MNRLLPGTVVSGRFGPLEYATPTSRRRSASVITGTVIEAMGPHYHKVRFMNGETLNCKSCKLRVVRPEDIPPSLRSTNNITQSAIGESYEMKFTDEYGNVGK